MSVVSNRHNVNRFISGESKPLDGQRLAKVGYKTTAKQPNPLPNVCVSIPQITVELDIPAYVPAFTAIVRSALENAQDGIIRSLYESSEGQLKSVSDAEISIAACIAFIEAENSGGRLTKEFLESWFDSTLAENLTVVIADKLGFEELNDEQMVVVGKHLNGYKGLISSLAGNKTMLQPAQINGIRRALELSKVDDEVCVKLNKKLDDMNKKPKIENLLEL